MTIDATSARRRPDADSDHSTQGRRHRPRWWMVLLAAGAAVVVATVVVIQLLPSPADGPAVVGATRVALRGNRFHPPVIQISKGQTVTWSFDDNGTTPQRQGHGLGLWRPGVGDVPTHLYRARQLPVLLHAAPGHERPGRRRAGGHTMTPADPG